MADRDMTTEILLQLQDNMTRQFEAAMRTVDGRANTTSSKFTQMFDKIKGGFDKMGKIAGKVILPFQIVSGAVQDVYNWTSDLVKEFEKINNQMNVLKSQKVWGDLKPQLEGIETATGGVVDQLDLLESVNKAVSFGIDLTNDRLIKLVGYSQKAALTMGTDLKYAFDSLIVGTARESKLILDNLGVIVDLDKATNTYAKSLNKQATDLTDVERKAALLNDVLKSLDRTQADMQLSLMRSSGTGLLNELKRDWRDIKLSAGETLTSLIEWFDELGMSAQEISLKEFSQDLSNQLIKQNELMADYFGNLKKAGYELDDNQKKRELAFMFQEKTNDLLQKGNEFEEINKRTVEYMTGIKQRFFEENGQQMDKELENARVLEFIEKEYGEAIANRLALEEGPMMEVLARQVGLKNMLTKATLINIKSIADAYASFESLHAGEMDDYTEKRLNGAGAFLDEFRSTVRNEISDEAINTLNQLDELNANVKTISAKYRNRNLEAKFKDTKKGNEKEKEYTLKFFEDMAVINYEEGKKILFQERQLREEREAEIGLLAVSMNKSMMSSTEELRVQAMTDNELRLELLRQNFENQQKELEIQRNFELQQLQEHQQRLNDVKQFGFDFAMSISNQMYTALITEQDMFTKKMIGNALKQVGGEVWADGWKNVMIGTGKLISTFGAVGGEQVAFGGVEIVAGAGMGYVGKTISPPQAAKDNSDAAKERNAESAANQINVTVSGLALYGGKTEARKEITELIEK